MKKILSLLLSITLLLGCVTGVSASAEAAGVTDTDEAIALLSYLGMIKSDEDISGNITRAEFASLVAKAIKAQPTSGKQYYTDVDSYYWALDAVTALTELGYLSGGDNMAFRPDDNIRLSEAAKIAAYMLGYGELSSAKGGWSAGYLQTASRLGITQGMSSEYITKEQAYVMLMRTMNTPLLVPGSISEGGTRYEVDESSTILSVYHDIYYIEDVVNAAGPVSLVPSAEVSEGEVLIGNKVFRTESISADMYEYLGMTIIGYYTETDAKNASLVVALPMGEENSVITVFNEDVTSIYDNGGYYTFEYYDEDDKKETIKVPRGCVVVKNGMSVTTNLFNEFAIDKGSYKFLDHNDDGKVDVLFVNEYYNLVVGLIENAEGMVYITTENVTEYYRGEVGSKRAIYDQFDHNLSIDVTEESGKIIKFKNTDGSLCSISDIVVSEVLSVYRSKDGKYIEVTRGKGSVKGTVDEISYPDNDTITVTIGDTEYDMDKAITEKIADNLELGFTGTFYLDAFGEIGFYTSDVDTSILFGYLTEVGSKQNGLNKSVYLKIFGQDGLLNTYTCYDKMTIDGSKISSLDQAYSLLSIHAKQMVRFSANANKEVTFMDTLTKDESKEGEKSISETLAYGQYIYSSGRQSFSTMDVTKSDTPMFIVPTDKTIDSGDYDETCFAVKQRKNILPDYNYLAATYRVDPHGAFEDVILLKSDYGYAISGYHIPCMVSEVKAIMDDVGELVHEIIVYEGKMPTKYRTVDDSVLKGYNLKKGDLVWFEKNIEGKIIGVNEILVDNEGTLNFKIDNSENNKYPYYSKSISTSADGTRTIKNSTLNSTLCVAYGYAGEMTDGVIRFAYTKEDCENENYVFAKNISTLPVIVYDKNSGRDGNIYWTSPSDVLDYRKGNENCSDVVVYMRGGAPRGIYVYK